MCGITSHYNEFTLQDELGDGMVQEVQKLLWQLVCYTGNKGVVMAFIKGCLDNIAINRYEMFFHRRLCIINVD